MPSKKIKKAETLASIKRKIIPILKKNHVVRAGIFGSYARGEQKKNSDIDILIKFNDSLTKYKNNNTCIRNSLNAIGRDHNTRKLN